MSIPFVKRVSPQLPGRRKIIRWNTRDTCGFAILTNIKQFRVSPGVSTIVGDKDRNIANDLNFLARCVILNPLPLGKEDELAKFVFFD